MFLLPSSSELFFSWSFLLSSLYSLVVAFEDDPLVLVLVLGVGDGGARPVGFWRGFG